MYKFRAMAEAVLKEEYPEFIKELITKYTNLPEDEQIARVTAYSHSIYYINNPSEKVQLAAVNSYGGNLKSIIKLWKEGRLENEPSDEVIKAAIKENPFVIINLPKEKQTPELQKLAIDTHPNSIYHINYPVEETWEELKKVCPKYFDILYKNWQERQAERQARKAAKLAATNNNNDIK